jgi:ribosomal protein S19E (S16A)
VRNFMKDFTVLCPDTRSSMLMKLEAFDISGGGYDVPYFRRQMAILAKLSARKELAAKALIKTFTRQQIEGIYPPLSPIILEILADELDLMGYLKIKDGIASITPRGKKKLKAFKAGLSEEEREVFEQY